MCRLIIQHKLSRNRCFPSSDVFFWKMSDLLNVCSFTLLSEILPGNNVAILQDEQGQVFFTFHGINARWLRGWNSHNAGFVTRYSIHSKIVASGVNSYLLLFSHRATQTFNNELNIKTLQNKYLHTQITQIMVFFP